MKLVAYLNFNGNAEEALKKYQSIFGGEITYMQRYKDAPDMGVSDAYKEKVLHARLLFGDNLIFVSDNFEGAPPLVSGNITLSMNFDDEATIDRVYAALKDGGTVEMPLEDTFWNAKYASIVDAYGIPWSLNYMRES